MVFQGHVCTKKGSLFFCYLRCCKESKSSDNRTGDCLDFIWTCGKSKFWLLAQNYFISLTPETICIHMKALNLPAFCYSSNLIAENELLQFMYKFTEENCVQHSQCSAPPSKGKTCCSGSSKRHRGKNIQGRWEAIFIKWNIVNLQGKKSNNQLSDFNHGKESKFSQENKIFLWQS